MKLNKLLGNTEDSYLDLYELTKEILLSGTILSFEIEMTNLTGLLVVKGPKQRKPIKALDDILNAAGIKLLNSKPGYRTSLLTPQKKVSYFLFADESVELEIKTNNNSTKFEGLSKEVIEYKKMTGFLEQVDFDKKDKVEFKIKLVKPGQTRKYFEESLNTDAFILELKKKNVQSVKNVLISMTNRKSAPNNKDLALLKDFDIITEIGIPLDKMIKDVSSWVERHENNAGVIRTFSSVFDHERYSSHSWQKPTNYANVLKKFSKNKSL